MKKIAFIFLLCLFLNSCVVMQFINPAASAASNNGIYVIHGYGDWSGSESFWQKSWLSGVKVMKYWNMLQPTEATFDFSSIDANISLAKKYGKKIIISIVTADERRGSYIESQATPEWVFQKGAKFVGMKYPQAENPTEETKVPVYWDTIYLNYYGKFVAKLAQKYNGHPQVARVEMGVGVFGETIVDRAVLFGVVGQKEKWVAFGLTSDNAENLWVDTIGKIVDLYKSKFTKTETVLTITDTALVPINNSIDRKCIGDKIAAYAAGKGADLQYCGMLNNWPYGDWPGKVLDGYASKVPVIYETANPSGGFGSYCDPNQTNLQVFQGMISNMKNHKAKSAIFWCNDIFKAAEDSSFEKEINNFSNWLKTQ